MNTTNLVIPTIIETDGRTERAYDPYSRLLKDRIIMIGTNFDDQMANLVVAQLLLLQAQDPKKDIHIYIQSGGGSVTAGLAIYDTINMLTCDVNTYCMGICASMAAVILSSGTKGKRFILPHAHSMIHQVSGGAQGTSADVERTVKFMWNLEDKLYKILAENVGKDFDTVKEDCQRDYYLDAEATVKYGLVDQVLEPNKD